MNGYQSFRLSVFEAYDNALITENTKDRLLDFSNTQKEDLIAYTEGVKDIQTAMYIIRLNNIRRAAPNPETADKLTIDFVNRNYSQLVNCIESLQKVDVAAGEKKVRIVVAIVNTVALIAINFIKYFKKNMTLIETIIGNMALVLLNLLADIIIKSLSKAQVNAQSSLTNLKRELLSIAYTRNVTDQERAQLEAIADKIEEKSSVYTEGVRDFQFQLYVVRLNNIRKSTPNPQTADRLTIDFVNRNYTQLVNCIESIPKVDVMEDERKARRIVAIVNIVALMANNFIKYYKKGVLMEDIILGNLAIVFLNILADFIIRLLGPMHANVQNNLVIFKKELLSMAQSSNVTDQERTRLEAIANKIQDVM